MEYGLRYVYITSIYINFIIIFVHFICYSEWNVWHVHKVYNVYKKCKCIVYGIVCGTL